MPSKDRSIAQSSTRTALGLLDLNQLIYIVDLNHDINQSCA